MELMPGIHIVDQVSCNVYLLLEDADITVIDTGMQGNANKVMAYIRAIGRQPEQITRILLTHQHVDHVGGAAALAGLAHPGVYAHPLDIPAITGTERREAPSGIVGVIFRTVLFPRLRPIQVTQPVRADEIIPVFSDDGGLQVIETPGHTQGHISFYLPGRKVLFAGDAYRHANGKVVSPPALFNYDNALALRTMRELPERVEIEASLPGHGAPILSKAGSLVQGAAKVAV